jgi:hypothetical protein
MFTSSRAIGLDPMRNLAVAEALNRHKIRAAASGVASTAYKEALEPQGSLFRASWLSRD